MDAGTFSAGMAVGGTIIGAFSVWYRKRDRAEYQREIRFFSEALHHSSVALMYLRRNAFLTNEHGHRVRYHKASAEVRARAEAGE